MQHKAHFDSEITRFPCRLASSASCPETAGKETEDRAIKLLLIEHDPSYAAYVKGLVEDRRERHLQIEWTRWLDVAGERIQEGEVDGVLLDISLPDISGLEIFRAIHRDAPELPVLIMADLDDETMACRLIREGAEDYLPKRALNSRLLYRSVRFALERNKAKKAGSHGRPDLPISSMAARKTVPIDIAQALSQKSPGRNSIASRPPDQTTRVLFLEHSDQDYRKLMKCLEGHEEEIRATRARTIRSALRQLARHPFDLVCLEYLLPDGTGHDFLTRMKESGLDVPSVVITTNSDPMTAAQIIQAGAYDYLPKQKLSRSPFFRIITNSLEKSHLRRQIQEAQKKILEMSIIDDLTGLYNRRHFVETVQREISRASRYSSPLVLCMMDLDEFKNVNDTYGHQAGDMVLRVFGNMLRGSIRGSDTACRYGGEEFALLLPNTDLTEAKVLAERLRFTLENHRFEWNGRLLQVTLSLGLAPLDREAFQSFTELVEMADEALYTAKRLGKNTVVSWDENWRDQALGTGSAMKP